MGGGVLNQFGYALIDLGLIYLLQQRALRVHAVFRTMQRKTPHIKGIRHITADDVAQVLIETDRRDCLVSLNLNTNFSQFSQELSITGSKGQLVLRNAVRLIYIQINQIYQTIDVCFSLIEPLWSSIQRQ